MFETTEFRNLPMNIFKLHFLANVHPYNEIIHRIHLSSLLKWGNNHKTIF